MKKNTQSEIERLRAALVRAEQDINWMLNSGRLLNPFVFDYIVDALEKK